MRTISNLFQNFSLASLADGLILALVAVFSICVHESCHGLMALSLGDDTAKRMGRISLNPLHHVDWYGLVMMVIFKFGWAKGVPVNSSRFKNPKLGMALTALAGPVSNIILSFFGVVGYFATAYRGWESADGILYYVNLLFFYSHSEHRPCGVQSDPGAAARRLQDPGDCAAREGLSLADAL